MCPSVESRSNLVARRVLSILCAIVLPVGLFAQTPVPFIVFSLVLRRRRDGLTRDHRKLVNSQSSDAVTSWARDDYENMDSRTGMSPCCYKSIIVCEMKQLLKYQGWVVDLT